MICKMYGTLAHLKANRLYHGRLFCKSWQCQHCRTHIQLPKWLRHARRLFTTTINAGRPIYRITLDHTQWTRIQKRLNRKQCHYICIKGHSRHFVYYAGHQSIVQDAQPCQNVHHILDRFKRDIENARSRKPLSTSNAWNLPQEPETPCKLISKRRLSKEALKRIARQHQLQYDQVDNHAIADGCSVQQPNNQTITLPEPENPSQHYLQLIETLPTNQHWMAIIHEEALRKTAHSNTVRDNECPIITKSHEITYHYSDNLSGTLHKPHQPTAHAPPDFALA